MQIGQSAPNEYMNGSIDDVYVFGSALTPAQVAALYANTGNLPATTPVQLATGATFDLNGVNQTVASLANVAGSGGVVTNSSAAAAVLTLSPSGGTSTFSGSIQNGLGGLSLVMSGSGTEILIGSNTYGGSTVVASGTLILSGSDSYTGGTYVDNGVLIVTAASALPTGTSLTVGAGGTFIFDPMATAAPVAASPAGAIAAVPEPASLVLLGVGALALLGYRRRRRS